MYNGLWYIYYKSFESLKSYWYNSVKSKGNEGIIFHIAGNKIDLFEEEEVDRNEIKEYCNNIGAEYNFISALENSFIDDLFNKVGERFLNSIYKNKDVNKQQKKSERTFSLSSENDCDNDNKRDKNKEKKCC